MKDSVRQKGVRAQRRLVWDQSHSLNYSGKASSAKTASPTTAQNKTTTHHLWCPSKWPAHPIGLQLFTSFLINFISQNPNVLANLTLGEIFSDTTTKHEALCHGFQSVRTCSSLNPTWTKEQSHCWKWMCYLTTPYMLRLIPCLKTESCLPWFYNRPPDDFAIDL